MLHSALYFGQVVHRRATPEHTFRYRLWLAYLDLAELPDVFDGRLLWSARRFAPAWFRRADYLGDPDQPLDTAVRDSVFAQTGTRPTGPIRMLTQLRMFGFCFNPVTFYYCFHPSGDTVQTLVAQITNTPWHERHVYVLQVESDASSDKQLRWRFPKAFHVSPFFGMDLDYVWRCTQPDERLSMHMENHRDGRCVFDVTLTMERRPITSRTLAFALLRHPATTWKVFSAIYWQALRLRWKKARFHPHPKAGVPRPKS